MTNAASTSNPSFIVEVGQVYPYPSHAIAQNFVTMKLSGKDTYNLWETQILCLLKSHQMYGFIDGQFPSPAGNGKGKVEDQEAWIISDSLVKGWILGSLSDRVAKKVVNDLKTIHKNTEFTAKDVWDEVQRSYGPSAASASNQSFIVDVGEAYPYPSHVSAPNFVTVKLSGKDTYTVWVTQILCLLWSQHMVGFIEDEFPSPAGNGKGKVGDIDAWIASDSLVKGWILGSLSDGVAKKVVSRLNPIHKNTYFTAKDLWDELQHSYGPSDRKQTTDSLVKSWILGSLSKEEAMTDVNHLTYMQENPNLTAKELWDELQCSDGSLGPWVREQAAETKLTQRQAESEIEDISESGEKTRKEMMDELYIDIYKRWLYHEVLNGNTDYVIHKLEKLRLSPWDKLTNNGNTVLHVAVGSSTKNQELLKKLLEMTPTDNRLLDLVNSNGSSLLHVAAIGGHIEAVNMLVERNPELLIAKDKEGHTPLALSVSNMHTKTSKCLFEHMKVYRYVLEQKEKECDALLSGEDIMTCKTLEQEEKEYDALFTGKSVEDIKTSKCLLEQQEKEYDALFTGKSCEDLVVLAISCQDFSLARRIFNSYPDSILSDAVLTALAQHFPREPNFWERGSEDEFDRIVAPYTPTLVRLRNYLDSSRGRQLLSIFLILFIVLRKVTTMFCGFLKVIVRLFFADTFEFQIHKDATRLLYDVCEIFIKDNSSIYYHYYTTLTFEATRRNASTLIRCIMRQFPHAIWITDEDGHNFIQYSVINRSEKIYNLIYEMSEHKNIYKTIKDSYGNNLLHLAARLAPTNKLNLISGAALQIQRELQWFKEVERFVSPLNRIQKNSDDETPEMVFTRVHKDLVIEGENWIKKTAESYTITAALITTIVFAAAITVPGGNNQEYGIPIFTTNIAFKVFAVSVAISLFTAVTSLLMFLSILTARFAEQDFLFKLPKSLIIGLTMLFLSTTTMIIAFGATLFLVFGQNNLSTLIPIGGLTCLPITSFVTLQFPLIVELISSTYCGGIFVREEYDLFY